MRKQPIFFWLLLLLWGSALSAQEIYKWKDEKGQWHFSNQPSNRPQPAVRLTAERVTYDPRIRYLTVEGTLENISSRRIENPRIGIKAHDPIEFITFASDISKPAGYEKQIDPGQSAVFRSTLLMPEKARGKEVTLDITVEGYLSDIQWKQGPKITVW